MNSYLLSLSKSYMSSFTGLTKESWTDIAISFMESTLSGVFYFLSLYFVNELKLSIATSGLIISSYGVGAILGGYLGGVLSDKISPKKVIVTSLIIQSLAYLILLNLVSVNLLIIDIFILGVASYAFITANNLQVLNACHHDESQRVKALNLLSVASNLGLGISGILIGFASYYGFTRIFIVITVMMFLLAIHVLLSKNLKSELPSIKNNIENHDQSIQSKIHYSKSTFWIMLLFVLLIGCIVAQLGTSYPIYIEQAFSQMGVKAVSVLFALNSFLVVLISTPIGEFSLKYNKILMVGVGGFLIGFSMLMLSFSIIFTLAIIACIIYTVGEIIFFSLIQFICYHSGQKRGKNLGLFRAVYASSRVFGPVMGGMIYSNFGGNMVWYLSGILGFICISSCCFISKYGN